MGQYLKLYRSHEEYENTDNRPYISHCIKEVHIHSDNGFNYGSDDDDPELDDYDLDAGYFF